MLAKDKQIPFIITLSFLLSFLAIRLAVIIAGSAESEFAQAAKAGGLPDAQFYIGSNVILFGYHIHHFYFGILLICVAAWLAIVGTNTFSNKQVAVLYGVGLGLFLDEIGLLLTWGDYHSSLSYTLSLLVLAIFLNILFFADFWKSFKQTISKQSLIHQALTNNKSPLYVLDQLANKALPKKKLSQAFTALLYLSVAVVVVAYPQSLRFWLAAVLILQGAKYVLTTQTGDLQHEI